MTFPNYIEKYISEPLFSPDDLLPKKREGKILPVSVILCYSPALLDYVKSRYKVTMTHFLQGEMYSFDETNGKTGIIGKFGFGAPVAVTLAESLISLGVERFINIGIAGSLQKHVDIGDIVLCDKAIRDEGTSYHYVEPAKFSHPTNDMTGRIKEILDNEGVQYATGPTWTTDAPYRETVAEIIKYRDEGVLTVEMEASALFALANHRKVEMGAIFTISDLLDETKWSPHFDSEKTVKGLEKIFDIAFKSLSV